MNAIEINGLTYTYPGEAHPTLSDISLQIEKGDFLAVVGNNGCGKSTLCKVLNGLIPHFITGEFQGQVRVEGLNTLDSDVGTLAQKVGYVYQDFENQIVRPTVLDDASYACLNYAFPDYLERGKTALCQCGLEGREEEYIWQLSGGQTHLLALAGAVSLSPDVLILDEPIAQLDPMHADRIYEVLRELNQKHGKTILVIEHHTEYIADYCRHVLLMKDGQAQWLLPTREALQHVEELEECNIFPPQVTQAAYRLRKEAKLPSGAPLPTTVEEGRNAFSALCFRPGAVPIPTPCPAGQRAVSFQDVSLSYRSVKGAPRSIFDGLNLDIRKGEKVALIGSNGAGKSTLMKLMVGLLRPQSGTVSLFDEPIGAKKAEDLSRQISLVYQNPEEMFIKDSIRADISYAMQVRGLPDWQERTDALLARFRLTELQDRDGRLMSGGQMRRASLAIGVALEPGILLLDEPTANLDIATRREIMGVLEDMKDIIQTAVIATHDMQLVCQWAERIIVLQGGRVVADGTRDEIFARQDLVDLVGIRPPEIFSMAQALNPQALCYTVEEFTNRFQEA
ncbi:ATP-binding cassette domain-containing protein [Clostridium sp. J1101437_171009_A5]|uniref:ABC transporter ATP-binding protein n=1 Tax=Clostridium sp. J1101437_171009_A5 TaxID=2787098 RepID=UPI00189A98EB|nr:ATP-binding cassette domain-containing protein [Clostridium sp. J1101437_171009_A5]MBS5134607.1 ABC transporter ATP-binding protein [Oscillospiraceae bacterium]